MNTSWDAHNFIHTSIHTSIMDTDKVLHLLSLLDDRLDDVKTSIAPLLNAPLTENASKLPVVDKAKLYILQVYAIESLLHCASRTAVIFKGFTKLTDRQLTFVSTTSLSRITPS